jgi:hypothetical protein
MYGLERKRPACQRLKNAKNFRFQSSFKKIKAIDTAFQAAWQARTPLAPVLFLLSNSRSIGFSGALPERDLGVYFINCKLLRLAAGPNYFERVNPGVFAESDKNFLLA